MGIYYRGTSMRTKTVDGMEFVFTNFYGKAPAWAHESNRSWNTFITKSDNACIYHRHRGVQYVMRAQNIADLNKYGNTEVAKWNGTSIMDDHFWDKNHVGTIIKDGRTWRFVQAEA